MKRIKLTFLVFVIVFTFFLAGWSFAAGAEENASEPEISPLNPEFVEYQQLKSNELVQNPEENHSEQNSVNNFKNSSGNSSENNFENSSVNNSGSSSGRLGYIPSPVNFSGLLKPESESNERLLLTSESELPTTFDLRKENRITSVKDQGNSGSCWAFASISSLESYLLNSTGEDWDFSENNMKNLLYPTYTEGFDVGEGGNAVMATAYLARWTGPVNESDDPYNDASYVSPEDLPVEKHVQEVLFLPVKSGPLDNFYIKKAIIEYGAVDFSFYFNSSDSNLYSEENCSYYYTDSYYRYPQLPNHAITIVGWNDSYDKNLFPSIPSGNGAFIAKNSWGTDWGKDGYFYISYYDSKLGYDENSVFTAGPLDNYDYIYQYDPLGWVETIGYTNNNTAWGANIFLATENETLKAVSFYTTDSGTNYEVYVYKNPDSGPINSTSYELCEEGSFTYSGYHTHLLASPVALSSGEAFSVVIKFENQDESSKNPLAFEYPEALYSSKANASENQSYISPDGENWKDLTETIATDLTQWFDLSNANLCIKAFTTANELPEASFSSNVTSDSAPLTVQFYDMSTGSSSWYWDFGDGSNSSEQNPVHTYTTEGTYNVNLTVTNTIGSDYELKSNYITVLPVAPVANFTANVTNGTAPFTVQFNDTSTGSLSSWYWDFGDGSNSSEQNPVHTYTTEGKYSVNMTVTNAGGSDYELKSDYITVLGPPVANFTANVTSGTVPLSVQFNDNSTGEPTSWYWEFGDGSNSTSQNPVHIYTEKGNYNVTLNVTNDVGNDSELKTSYITVSSSSSSSSGGSSGGGGGGGSVSPYTSDEITVKELAQSYTSAGEPFKVTFSDEQNPVIETSFIPNVAIGKIYVTVTVLNGVPDSIGTTPNGEIFQVLDIEISKSLGSKLESGNVTFKVTKEWLDSLGDNYTVIFQHFEDGKWVECPTEPSPNDAYTFIASIDSCSPFAITAEKAEEESQSIEITTPSGKQAGENETLSKAEETKTEEKNWFTTLKIGGILIGVVILALLWMAISKNKKNQNKKE